MCRFKNDLKSCSITNYCSCFNTSYVSVQEDDGSGSLPSTKFQYILCVGPRLDSILAKIVVMRFNTSYVSVQVYKSLQVQVSPMSFNTSYVSVQVIMVL